MEEAPGAAPGAASGGVRGGRGPRLQPRAREGGGPAGAAPRSSAPGPPPACGRTSAWPCPGGASGRGGRAGPTNPAPLLPRRAPDRTSPLVRAALPAASGPVLCPVCAGIATPVAFWKGQPEPTKHCFRASCTLIFRCKRSKVAVCRDARSGAVLISLRSSVSAE